VGERQAEHDAGSPVTRSAFGAKTDVGRVRATNEDRYVARPPLFLVADGMGGQNAGEVAAAMTAELLEAGVADGSLRTMAELDDAVGRANASVWERSGRDRELQGMGTTCTAVLVTGPRVLIAHVGDSRAYLLRGDELRQLTTDHTFVQGLIDQGQLRPEDVATHPQRSVIVRAIGAAADIVTDRLTIELEPGDRLLLCSDGLSSLVTAGAIAGALAGQSDPQAAAERLVELANTAGGIDNVTAVVVDPDGMDTAGSGRAIRPSAEGRLNRRQWRRRLGVSALLLGLALGIAGLAAIGAFSLPGATAPTPASPAPSTGPPVASPSPSGGLSPSAPTVSPPVVLPSPIGSTTD
jgi:serine/threonine protein phosphatase PrpC